MEARPNHNDVMPESDVSQAVGLSGLAGLMAWLLLARHWGLTGPLAITATIACSAVPMVLVSLWRDKVHLRATTGINWTLRRSRQVAMDLSITKLAGLWATWALIAAFYGVGKWYWSGNYLFAMQVLQYAALPLFALSIPYVCWLDRRLIDPRDGCWHFGAMLIGREAWHADKVREHARAWAIKAFFTAFMLSIMPSGFHLVMNADPLAVLHDPVKLASLLIGVLFMIDVQMAMAGYLLTLKPLDAHIRSGNPHLGAWLAALACYPPFTLMAGGGPFDYRAFSAEWSHWLAGHSVLLWAWGAVLVFLTAIYAWATVIFGIRFSNLTYRGVITNGPYRFLRHPAYVSKNLFWWLAAPPFLVTSGSVSDALRNTALLGLVSAIYWWRARTEEAHLLAEDVKYRDYVTWMDRHGLAARLSRLRRQARLAVKTPINPEEVR